MHIVEKLNRGKFPPSHNTGTRRQVTKLNVRRFRAVMKGSPPSHSAELHCKPAVWQVVPFTHEERLGSFSDRLSGFLDANLHCDTLPSRFCRCGQLAVQISLPRPPCDKIGRPLVLFCVAGALRRTGTNVRGPAGFGNAQVPFCCRFRSCAHAGRSRGGTLLMPRWQPCGRGPGLV